MAQTEAETGSSAGRIGVILDLIVLVGLLAQSAGLWFLLGPPAAATIVGSELVAIGIAGAIKRDS